MVSLKSTKQFWLTFHVPESTGAGIYAGSVDFQPENRPPTRLTLKVKVLPFVLKPASRTPIGALIFGGFSPVFWAVNGLQKLFIENAGFGDISLHLVILYGVAVLTVVPGTLLLRNRVKRGG